MTAPPTEQVVTVGHLIAWFRRYAEAIEAHADSLSSLDAAIGDADHGTNMRRGCQAVVSALDTEPPADVTGFGRATGMRLISAVGGTSGPLYGSFFLAFGSAGGAVPDLTGEALVACWRAGADAVSSRGKAEQGDKTMMDAMEPAVAAMEAEVAAGNPLHTTLDAGLRAAEAGMHATTPMVARKGRASYLGERSAGHQDPGATSSWLLVRSCAEVLNSSDAS